MLTVARGTALCLQSAARRSSSIVSLCHASAVLWSGFSSSLCAHPAVVMVTAAPRGCRTGSEANATRIEGGHWNLSRISRNLLRHFPTEPEGTSHTTHSGASRRRISGRRVSHRQTPSLSRRARSPRKQSRSGCRQRTTQRSGRARHAHAHRSECRVTLQRLHVHCQLNGMTLLE